MEGKGISEGITYESVKEGEFYNITFSKNGITGTLKVPVSAIPTGAKNPVDVIHQQLFHTDYDQSNIDASQFKPENTYFV